MKLKVVYSKEHVNRPVLASVVVKTGELVNILEASITPRGGEMVIDVPSEGNVEKVVEAFRREGVIVKELAKQLEVDIVRCIACGACVSPCPVGAIRVEEGVIRIEEEKCVRCQACIYACPVRAIRLL
ncbi:MAG: 4Fe-4S binding protein [Candidatus Nezhaarchaeota archaeon]|nr:4Fe-4S binding protein [Candidatus Nezhaarchaeota archaeon]